MLKITVTSALLLSYGMATAQTPPEQLARPPASARHLIIQSSGGKHGDSWIWMNADGTHMGRESMNLRGQVSEMDYRGKGDANGMPVSMDIRGVTPQGDAAETFQLTRKLAQWKSPVDAGEAHVTTPVFYTALGGPMGTTAWFMEALLTRPDHSMALLPGGRAHAAKLTSVTLHGTAPAKSQTVDLWSVTGVSNSPFPVWADASGHFFALVSGGLGWVPEAYAGEQVSLETAQAAALARQGEVNVKTLVTMPRTPVAFVHVREFDADGLAFLADRTLIVDKEKIIAEGPAASIVVPAGAKVIDGRGKTLIPGLWDCHMHVGDDYTGVQELSLGVTSVRDPGNNDAATLDRRTRSAAGKLLMPHVYASSLIDGKGPYSAQVANIATSEAEAIALVDRAKTNGFTGVKFYGTFNPAWLPAAIAEAHKQGLHVHGHIPAGIRPVDAIDDGYDEVTHINWIVMQAAPDDVIAVSNGIMRFEGPGRFAKDLDLDGPPMQLIVDTMAKKHTYSDPTMVAFESLYVPENGDLSPSYAPFVGTLPPTIERGFRAGGFAVPKDLTRADYRASWAKMVAVLARLHKAGVPIVSGTDGSGIELVHELEIYEEAGFTPAEALAAATIEPARLVDQDRHTGSLKVGKAADLALVDGDPEAHIGALRQTRIVMLDGKLLDADALRTAAGYSGRPK